MRSFQRSLYALAALAGLLPGCGATQQVRYVYQDREFGVIGMPENSDRWPTRYRTKAEKLMKAQFPDGHEIVRAEEVVEGERTLTSQDTNTAEVLPTVTTPFLQIGKLGRSSGHTQADKLKLKECRIIYRRTGQVSGSEIYAPLATLTPTQYIDPNEAERHPSKAAAEKEKSTENKSEPPLNLGPPKDESAAAAAQTQNETSRQTSKGNRIRSVQD